MGRAQADQELQADDAHDRDAIKLAWFTHIDAILTKFQR